MVPERDRRDDLGFLAHPTPNGEPGDVVEGRG